MMSSTRTTPITTLALLALVLCAGPALAQESGTYVGASVGKALPPDDDTTITAGSALLHGDGDDETDQMWQVFMGYRMNRHFAIETSYLDLGTAHDVLSGSSGATDSLVNVKFSARGWTLSAIATYPLGKWQPYVKAGIFFSETELAVDGSVGGTPFSAGVEGKSADLFYGIGLAYNINDRWQVKLDLMKFNDVGDSDSNLDYRVTSLGFSRRF